jgi:hypothetical protein
MIINIKTFHNLNFISKQKINTPTNWRVKLKKIREEISRISFGNNKKYRIYSH